jgi:hypothetical protein
VGGKRWKRLTKNNKIAHILKRKIYGLSTCLSITHVKELAIGPDKYLLP